MRNDIMSQMEQEHHDNSGFMSYEDLMQSRKITFQDVKEHMTGPVISTIIHVVLLGFLGTVVVFEAPKQSKEITVEMKTIKPKEIKPPPPPPEPPEPVETDNVVDDVPVETPDVKVDVDVKVDNISVDTPADVELPNALNMKMTNSALKLAVPVGGGHGRRGGVKIGGFGYGKKADGDLVGVMYDLKTKPGGAVRSDYNAGKYWDDVKAYIDKGLKYTPSLGFRQMKKQLFLSHLLIAKMSAGEGPKQFGVEKEMKPSGFFIHYSGKIKANKPFRFAGQGDDLLIVLIDKKVVLDASWNHCLPGYKLPQPNKQYKCFTGQPLVFGNWIQPGIHKIDLLFGERPGGLISAVLLIQEKGKTYPKDSDGRPILPLFNTMKLNKEEKKRAEAINWKMATDAPPMGYGGKVKVKKEKEVKGLEIL